MRSEAQEKNLKFCSEQQNSIKAGVKSNEAFSFRCKDLIPSLNENICREVKEFPVTYFDVSYSDFLYT